MPRRLALPPPALLRLSPGARFVRLAHPSRWSAARPRRGRRFRPFSAHKRSFAPASCTIAAVAYDEDLAQRIRELLSGESGVTEKKMFGGLAFLIEGNMAVAASGQGGVLVRVDPSESDRLVATTDARLMEMRGRKMRGWLRVDSDDGGTKRQLARWVRLGATYARSLPAKR
jgi:TfoX/Sxy family transcriptional regulator of competence genes